MSGLLEVSTKDGVLNLRLNAEKNLLREGVLAELLAFFEDLARNPKVRAVVFSTASKRVFLAGADIEELSRFGPFEAERFSALGQRLFAVMEDMPQCVVAAVEGACRGGGVDFILACDAVLATPEASFGHGGVKLGILTGFGGTVRLPERIGPSRALRMFRTGESISAGEALRIGLVDEVVESRKLSEACRRFAEGAVRDAAAFRLSKELRVHARRLTEAQRLLLAERLEALYGGETRRQAGDSPKTIG